MASSAKASIKKFIKTRLLKQRETREIFLDILKDNPIVAADVGAAAGLPPHWAKLIGVANFLLFEPNKQSLAELQQQLAANPFRDMYTLLPDAVSDINGEETLTITNVPTGSTIMTLDEKSDGMDYLSNEYFFPSRSETIQTSTLSSVMKRERVSQIHLLKIDVQGAEEKTIKGIKAEDLDSLLSVEVEIGLVKIYQKQPPFTQVIDHLTAQGFQLYDLRVSRTHRSFAGNRLYYQKEVFGCVENSFFLSARAWEFDAIFFKDPKPMLAKGNVSSLLRLLVCYCTYNFHADAHNLVREMLSQKLIDANRANQLFQLIKEAYWSSHPLTFTESTAPFISTTRGFFHALLMHPKKYWARYMWTEYPNN